ncbi:hypothetical protein THZG08_570002 [Vibrio owensii]|nr:hypothetical protein THZG08_570002 [Vibrio owensii]CAH1586086.1 hypothetical protein THOA03_570002 [Vibrio owensii]
MWRCFVLRLISLIKLDEASIVDLVTANHLNTLFSRSLGKHFELGILEANVKNVQFSYVPPYMHICDRFKRQCVRHKSTHK